MLFNQIKSGSKLAFKIFFHLNVNSTSIFKLDVVLLINPHD